MLRAVLASVSTLAALGQSASNIAKYDFSAYLADFEKVYDEAEHARRREVFNANLQKMQLHNAEYEAGVHDWWMDVNQFADWTPAEFSSLLGRRQERGSAFPALQSLAEDLPQVPNPDSMDWREKKAVTAVKNQGGCGSCWAFAAIETVESHHAIYNGELVELAPQAYVSCVENPDKCGGTGGCSGATMELAYNLTVDKGVPLESSLPYKARDGTCTKYQAVVKADGYVKLPVNDAKALETAVATKGPIAVTVAAEQWQLYGGGLFSGCSKSPSMGADLDHGVQVVGYTQDYWIVRNSWGAGWGEKGYIRVSRKADADTFINKHPSDGDACLPYPKTQTVGGECGILFDTAYPTGVHSASLSVVV
mmetsp:Transcript_11130/g.25233  ORF Transcript_11130/g.25233 Transcript_11130/m.25233 type:complete len:365 (+) Transcript_11130:82-1176(+)